MSAGGFDPSSGSERMHALLSWFPALSFLSMGSLLGDHLSVPAAGDQDQEERTSTREADARAFYDKLEPIVLPTYYQDWARWIWTIEQAISRVGPQSNTQNVMRRDALPKLIGPQH
jgi:hypothetical protein